MNAAEITKVFEDLKKKLDQEINEKKGAELLKRYYKDSLPLLQANFYSTLIEGRVPEEELGKYININRMISGATILGDGSVALIIDANTLV